MFSAWVCFKKVIKSAPYLARIAKTLHVNGTSDQRECRKQAFQEPWIKSTFSIVCPKGPSFSLSLAIVLQYVELSMSKPHDDDYYFRYWLSERADSPQAPVKGDARQRYPLRFSHSCWEVSWCAVWIWTVRFEGIKTPRVSEGRSLGL